MRICIIYGLYEVSGFGAPFLDTAARYPKGKASRYPITWELGLKALSDMNVPRPRDRNRNQGDFCLESGLSVRELHVP